MIINWIPKWPNALTQLALSTNIYCLVCAYQDKRCHGDEPHRSCPRNPKGLRCLKKHQNISWRTDAKFWGMWKVITWGRTSIPQTLVDLLSSPTRTSHKTVFHIGHGNQDKLTLGSIYGLWKITYSVFHSINYLLSTYYEPKLF